LEDAPRAGRPPTYSREHVGEIVATALTDPQTLDLPFQSWTLDRLAAYLSEQKGIAMKRSRLGEVLLTEGLRWRQQETWFGERVDPEFAQKRGR
jgi:transposase